MLDDLFDGIGFPEMFAKPLLAGPHHGIRMRVAAHQCHIGQLAFTVPFQKIHLGNAQCLAWTAVARNNMYGEIMPRRSFRLQLRFGLLHRQRPD